MVIFYNLDLMWSDPDEIETWILEIELYRANIETYVLKDVD